MFKRISTDTINTILIIGVILLIVEVVFFEGGLVFSLIFFGFMLYVGWKKYRKTWGKIFFWLGLIVLVFTVLSMIAVRFLIVAIIFLFVRDYYRTKKTPERITPEIIDQEIPDHTEPILKQKLFGNESTPNSYVWQDINIHGGFGDRVIDLSQTVLPKDEAVISIRHLVGNLVIYVPYDVEVSILHSSVFGRSAIFQYQKSKVLNQVVSYQTPGYSSQRPRVKIVTSLLSGNLEVKRI
ncbi:cell wall-active antibiotics response protein LiaF [Halobacillus salinus]|uniref:Cell wall-active antibiotics response LiaF-like C-terminal domain-containing protein n=1 Tax=Halobacillus salinus TaxID=192814 RepID=A0A4Z0H1H6_9BACI|nr:cell wall-active antibiotics response protein LiaF [Halobacillus salinus]TGB02721.1 hypothetical protein E4663_11210 [Halobacillus salinus]